MADLVPQPLDPLLRRLAHELSAGAAYDLPARSFFRSPEGLDLSVGFHGNRAGNAVGPAAGPQSQLAQNLVLSYLAGGRIMELKTVQVNDQLVLPRPCIDATNVGYNVEWSQELRLQESLEEYVKGWVLLHALRHADLGLGLEGPPGEFLFDMSVGYDLKGIQSAPVRRFLAGMLDARTEIDRVFESWPKDLLAWRPDRARVPDRISNCITLSTFHGCPANEIESICDFLLDEIGVHVIVKLNPTLLGYEGCCEILNGKLGYDEIRPQRDAFEHDLKYDEALGLIRRLSGKAAKIGQTLGAKFSNTLVVENHKSFFPGSEKVMYMSGAPLHVLTFELCRRFRESYGEALPLSFSAGVDKANFADCVAAGFAPITTCTDLLKPGGYARLPKYFDGLVSRMKAAEVKSIADFILAAEEGVLQEAAAGVPDALEGPAQGRAARLGANAAQVLERASQLNHRKAAARVLADPRYTALKNRAIPRRLGSRLWFFDCVSCDKCVQVCPNDANFTVELPREVLEGIELQDLVLQAGATVRGEKRIFKLKDQHQLANFADFCNECGNCDIFCPEEGGPYILKPRFFSSKARMLAAPARLEGFAVEQLGHLCVIEGRHEGAMLKLTWDRASRRAVFEDGAAIVKLTLPTFEVRDCFWLPQAKQGHQVRLDRARALLGLLEGLFREGASSPVNASFLPAIQVDAARLGIAPTKR